MKTIEQIALQVAEAPGNQEGVIEFAVAVHNKWLEQQEPVAHQFQDKDGKWYNFINESHYQNTLEDGYPIRALFLAPSPAKSELDSEYTRGRNDGYEAALLFVKQQSQEPVAYMAPSGTCVTAEDVSYTPNWTDYYTIPLYAAPPAKVDQQSQEPVAWYSHSGTLAYDKKSFPPSTQHLAKPLFLAPPPAKTFIRERAQLEQEWLNLRQLTEASKAKPPAIPEGYVLVPKEPTEAMILAARQSHEEEAYLPYSVYKSMIEAAQGEKP